jgi:hypothetical protein
MEKLTTQRSSSHTADVLQPIIIDENDITRRVFIAHINDTKINVGETVGGTIIHQRKKKNSEWEDIESINLATLKGGEGVKITLDSKQLKIFYDGIEKIYKLSMKGLSPGRTDYAIAKIDEMIEVPKNRKKFISALLAKNYGQEIWEDLIINNPDLATRLSLARIQNERQRALKEFHEGIKLNKSEDYWQQFFEQNQWIFGYGLKYCFMTHLQGQPAYGGIDVTGSGNQKGDFLLSTEANTRFTVLVEIKKPSSPLIAVNTQGKQIKYRNGAYLLSSELLGGISQVQINCKTWLSNSSTIPNYERLNNKNIHTVQPKGILLIGNTKEFASIREKIETFESLRRNLANPEIITFDELYARASFIVENDKTCINETKKVIDDEIPF